LERKRTNRLISIILSLAKQKTVKGRKEEEEEDEDEEDSEEDDSEEEEVMKLLNHLSSNEPEVVVLLTHYFPHTLTHNCSPGLRGRRIGRRIIRGRGGREAS